MKRSESPSAAAAITEGSDTKRQRLVSPLAGHTSTHREPAQAAAEAETEGLTGGVEGGEHDPLDSVPDAPVHLMRVRGIPSWANEGFLGVKLSDLVRGPMRWVLASNYMMDLAWLLSACPDLKAAARLVLLHGERPGGQHALKIAQDARAAGIQDKTTIFAPPLPISFGVHHSKAFLIHYDRGLRVVIFTANAIYPDCNNKTQGVFWQDFPPKDNLSPESCAFQQDLGAYLAELRLPPSILQQCRRLLQGHDFSAARARLVASVPGYHRGAADLHRWGHMKVRALLKQEPPLPATFATAPLVAQYSSMGSVDEPWLLREFQASLAASRCVGGSGSLGTAPQGPAGLRIVWPAVSEVQNSIEGWLAGRSIPGPAKNVDRPYLHPYYHRWGGEVCGRQRAMPHIKTFLRHQGQEVAWMYVGSHNLSKAAWGQLQKKDSQVMVRHYELGVLLVPSREAAYRASRWHGFSCTSMQPWQQQQPQQSPPSVRFVQWQRGSSQEAEVAADGQLHVPLPIPYRLPPQHYEQGDRPWAVDTAWPGIDSLGRTVDNPYGAFYGLLESMEWGGLE